MSDQPQEQTDVGLIPLPIVLTTREIQGVLSALRKFPMEQVEALVLNIQAQANQALANIQANKPEGEDK